MNFLEKDLEQIIFETCNDTLMDRGLWITGEKIRQLKIGNYGIADLITWRRVTYGPCLNYLEINIYELKKDRVGVSAFFQAVRYMKGISSYMKRRRFMCNYGFNIHLVGKSIDDSGSLCYLTDHINREATDMSFGELLTISFYEYKYDIDGLTFLETKGYELVNSGF